MHTIPYTKVHTIPFDRNHLTNTTTLDKEHLVELNYS